MLTNNSIKPLVIFLILQFSLNHVHAGDTLYFAGNINVSKNVSYGYILRFAVDAQSKVTGYTLTDAGGPNETKTKILGTFDSTEKTLIYEETNVLRSKVDLQKADLNFVHATLKFKHNKLFETLVGKFTAMQPGRTEPTANGEIKLINTDKVKQLTKKIDDYNARHASPTRVFKNGDTAADGLIKVFDNTAEVLPFSGNHVKLTVWDNGQVDGDRISIKLNDRYLLENYTLDSIARIIETDLPSQETDTIKIIALNEGTLPPNTGIIRLESATEHYPIEVKAKINEVRTIYLRRKKVL